MLFYLAILLAPAPSAEPQQDRGVYVSRSAFDCFTGQIDRARRERRSRGQRHPERDVFYLDLRRCPPNASVEVAPRRLGSFPSFRRPRPPVSRFPDYRGTAGNNAPVDRVLVVTGAELNCIADAERRERMRSSGGPGRYKLEFDRCTTR